MSKGVHTINPSTGETLKSYTLQSYDEASEAVERAHKAFLSWSQNTPAQRGEVLQQVANLMEEREEELARLMTREMGKPIAQGRQEVQLCAAICRYSAEEAIDALKEERREMEDGEAIICYRPIGVILGIQPWNFPLYQVIRYSAANLVAGNVTVLKHAGNVFGMAQAIESLYLDAGLPPGCYQSLLIDGEVASQLIGHERIRGVTFTGSDSTGKKVAERAARHIKKTVLELGSNDAFVVLSDADVGQAVASCVQGRVINNGETCVAAKRFIVTDSVYDEFRSAFVDAMKAIQWGDPTEEDTELGPMAREDLREQLHEQVESSVKKGATLLCGGEIPEGRGFFYPPTILADVEKGMPAYDDELFGPVASLIRAKDDQDAMRIANDSRYGLGGGLFTKDTDRAIRLARDEFDTGMVNINGYHLAQPQLPFGGVKDSGYGREHGGFGIREFVNIKTIMISRPQKD